MYPYGNPSNTLSGYWSSGDFTPEQVVKFIRNNITPIDKNSLRNSVGKEISAIQNFVNKNYLGRIDDPVNSGFFQYISTSSVDCSAARISSRYSVYPTELVISGNITLTASGSYYSLIPLSYENVTVTIDDNDDLPLGTVVRFSRVFSSGFTSNVTVTNSNSNISINLGNSSDQRSCEWIKHSNSITPHWSLLTSRDTSISFGTTAGTYCQGNDSRLPSNGTFTSSFTGFSPTPSGVLIKLVKTSNVVTMYIPAYYGTSSDSIHMSNGLIPAAYRPVESQYCSALFMNGSVYKTGYVTVNPNGQIDLIVSDTSGNVGYGNFTVGVNNGFDVPISVTYHIG